jgi:hypothetical protein
MSQWQLPAVVALILTWLNAPSPSLGDLARREALRRQLTPASTRSLNVNDLPATGGAVAIPVSLGSPDEQAASGGDAEKKDEKGEKYWRDRMAAARQALDRDRMMVEAMQSRINALTTDFIARDDPAQKAILEQTRIKALEELERLKKQVTADEKEIENVQTDARRAGVPAGWVR